MEKFLFITFLKLYILIKNLIFSNEQMQYFPEDYIQDDLLIPENDRRDEFQYNLVDAKLLTKKKITFYIKKQGINLDRDDCCLEEGVGYETLDAWTKNKMNEISQLEEIYSNAIYNEIVNKLEIKFPVPKIESEGYTLFYKAWIFDKNVGSPRVKIYFNNNAFSPFYVQLDGNGRKKIEVTITYVKIDENNGKQIINVNGDQRDLDQNFEFSSKV